MSSGVRSTQGGAPSNAVPQSSWPHQVRRRKRQRLLGVVAIHAPALQGLHRTLHTGPFQVRSVQADRSDRQFRNRRSCLYRGSVRSRIRRTAVDPQANDAPLALGWFRVVVISPQVLQQSAGRTADRTRRAVPMPLRPSEIRSARQRVVTQRKHGATIAGEDQTSFARGVVVTARHSADQGSAEYRAENRTRRARPRSAQ